MQSAMPDHQTPLIATIAAGLVVAFLFGRIAHRFRVSPLVGYLLAGIAVGPFTPGFVADAALAGELAEIGVILLMFAVGLHFSVDDLMKVRAIAVPGAIAQMAVATLLGMGLALMMGWGLGAGLVFGLALSVASTVVLVRALQERRIVESERGRIAVGWLVVEDLAMVLALVLLPTLAPLLSGGAVANPWGVAVTIGITLLKVAAFVAIMLLAGRRVIPWIMHDAAHTGSRELFRLAVYAVALGVAFGAAKLFGVSFALGAFFAGMVLGESKLSQRAAEEAMPLRDAFAVLFFVSVGMLFNPAVLLSEPLAVLGAVLIIVFGKSLAAYALVRAFGHPAATALTVSVALAQIGEFSFILVGLGGALGLLPQVASDTVLAAAILSILANPVLFALAERRRDRRLAAAAPPAPAPAPPEPEPAGLTPTTLSRHEVVVGHGRVGGLVAAGLRASGRPVLVIEEAAEALAAARALGCETIAGNAADPAVLAAAGLAVATRLFVTVPEAFEAGQVVQQARAAAPGLPILARAHSEAAVAHLGQLGATLTVMGEREIAHRMLEAAALPH
jgi:CPA2 family monovalent cation:H+ antiporter-2